MRRAFNSTDANIMWVTASNYDKIAKHVKLDNGKDFSNGVK